MNDDYELLDSGNGRKLERFGAVTLVRPAAPAVWRPSLSDGAWQKAAASFDRTHGNRWHNRQNLPPNWSVTVGGIAFKLSSTNFGHLGIFPEQRAQWDWIRTQTLAREDNAPRVLNLFAYSGGATLAAAQGGAQVQHVDASKGMVDWARENAALNSLDQAPVRWIIDNVAGFLRREIRRAKSYDAIILDPPSFGRGKRSEVFKIQEHLPGLLDLCRELLSTTPAFVLLSCHTPEYSPTILGNLLDQWFIDLGGSTECGEMMLTGKPGVTPLPSGTYARWTAC